MSSIEIEKLKDVTTATITMVLLKHGLRNVWMRGAKPLHGAGRVVGRAFTMRFLPAREDLATPASLASNKSTRAAVEAMPSGSIVVVDALGVTDAGIFGDILCERMKILGVAGVVSDGVVRDITGVQSVGLPIWCQGTAAPPSVSGLTFVGWNEPIACGGVVIFPGDVIVADEDGAVVIPQTLVEQVIDAALKQERFEAWVVSEVRRGVPLLGLYPPNADAQARYAAFKGDTN
ncbi:MAG: ribonuclease activity regulator RraA [Rhizobiales bacterium]|nr:ribonuclease activity regulator RraA [Hyphomicrobiales bacterium]